MITSEILRVWALRLPREVRRRQRKDSTHDEAAGERDSNQTGSLVRLGRVRDGVVTYIGILGAHAVQELYPRLCISIESKAM